MKKTTLTKQFMIIIWGVIALAMLFCWVLLSHFSERYYQHTRIRVLEDAYDVVNDASKNGTIVSEGFKDEIDKITIRNNMSLIIYDRNGSPAYTSGSDTDMMVRRYFDILMSGNFSNGNAVVETKDGYVILKQHDDKLDTDYMTMYAMLGGGESLLMSFSLESITDMADTFNQYIIFVGFEFLLIV